MSEVGPATNLPSLPTARSESDAGDAGSLQNKNRNLVQRTGRHTEEWQIASPTRQQQQQQQSPWQARTPRNHAELQALLKEIESNRVLLPEKPKPKLLEIRPGMKAVVRLQRIQRFISSFEYNHTGTNYFSIRKDRGPKRLASTAREIMRECLPIKCIEAVFLAFYLTLQMTDIVRIPVRFQSTVQNGKQKYKHIVMVVCADNKWGALGLSRKRTLMYKDLAFSSLSTLLKDFRDCYAEIDHELEHIGIGLPFGHNEHSVEPIHWRPLMIHFNKGKVWDQNIDQVFDTYASKIDLIAAHVNAHGSLPPWFLTQFPFIVPVSKSADVEEDRFMEPGPGSPKRTSPKKSALKTKLSTTFEDDKQKEPDQHQSPKNNPKNHPKQEQKEASRAIVDTAYDRKEEAKEEEEEERKEEEEEEGAEEEEPKEEALVKVEETNVPAASNIADQVVPCKPATNTVPKLDLSALSLDDALERRASHEISSKFSPLNRLPLETVLCQKEPVERFAQLSLDAPVQHGMEMRSTKSEPLNPGVRPHEKRSLKASPIANGIDVAGADTVQDLPCVDRPSPTANKPAEDRSVKASPRTHTLVRPGEKEASNLERQAAMIHEANPHLGKLVVQIATVDSKALYVETGQEKSF